MLGVGLLVLRLVLGVIFIGHGAQKLFGSFGGPGLKGTAGFFEQVGIKPPYLMAVLAGLAEFVGGILVILGFLTPLAALALIGVMIVAVLTVHLKNGFLTNGGYEFNLALAGMALTLLIAGAGAYSLDSALGILWQ
jgi:putative oxidoreductase